MNIAKRPLTIGKLITGLIPIYFIGAFVSYMIQYGWYKFFYEHVVDGVYIYSAAIGLLFIGVIVVGGLMHILSEARIPKFVEYIWNYPLIK
jgi:Na+/H+-dicarboxylate symporter